MRNEIKKLVNATNIIDKTYAVKGRSMAVKPNIVVLFYAIANSENLSQRQLRDEWMLPLSTINTITTECRNAGYITLEPIPGKRRECYLRFTEKGEQFADMVKRAFSQFTNDYVNNRLKQAITPDVPIVETEQIPAEPELPEIKDNKIWLMMQKV